MRIASVIAIAILSATAAHAQSKEQAISHERTVTVTRPEAPGTTNYVVYRSIKHPAIAYSGALVQAIKSRRPLQLINPFAPRAYGSAAGNSSQDPITGQADGFRLFTVSF